MLEHGATGVEGAEQVDVDYGFETVGRHAKGRCRKVSRSAADYEIDLAPFITGRFYGGSERIVVPHIGGVPRCGAACFRYFVHRGIQFFLRAADQGDTCPVIRKASRDGEVDPAAAAGDQRVLSGKQL